MYTRIASTLDQMTLMNTLVAIREDLGERTSESGLVMLEKQATTVGRVLAVGAKVEEDIRAGDLVLYEQWQGGRWQLGDDKMLIMDIEHVLAVIRHADGSCFLCDDLKD